MWSLFCRALVPCQLRHMMSRDNESLARHGQSGFHGTRLGSYKAPDLVGFVFSYENI